MGGGDRIVSQKICFGGLHENVEVAFWHLPTLAPISIKDRFHIPKMLLCCHNLCTFTEIGIHMNWALTTWRTGDLPRRHSTLTRCLLAQMSSIDNGLMNGWRWGGGCTSWSCSTLLDDVMVILTVQECKNFNYSSSYCFTPRDSTASGLSHSLWLPSAPASPVIRLFFLMLSLRLDVSM